MSAARKLIVCASLAFVAGVAAPRALRAATTRIVTWGDSITYGYHDFPNSSPPNACWDGFPTNNPPESCGTAARLAARLNAESPSWDVQLINLGKGGEVTAEALSRLCRLVTSPQPPGVSCPLACPNPYAGEYQINSLKHWICNGTLRANDVFVLMEGTNNITQQPTSTGAETAAFDLGVLGQHARDFDLNVVISSVIPRHPDVEDDPSNQDTLYLNELVEEVGVDNSWTFSDAYCRLRRTPGMASNVYQNYCGWNDDGDPGPRNPGCGNGDPCGHPNTTGFDRMVCNNSACGAGSWSWTSDPDCPTVPAPLETVVKSVLPPRVTLTVPGGTLVTGTSYLFSAALHDLAQTNQVTWNFGDGTIVSVVPSATPSTRDHTYYVPGPYTVTVTVRNPNGAQRSASQGIVLTGVDLTLFRGDFESGDSSAWSLVQP